MTTRGRAAGRPTTERNRAHGEAVPLDLLVEGLPDAILVVDEDGTILRANRHARELLAAAEHELVGASIDLLVPG